LRTGAFSELVGLSKISPRGVSSDYILLWRISCPALSSLHVSRPDSSFCIYLLQNEATRISRSIPNARRKMDAQLSEIRFRGPRWTVLIGWFPPPSRDDSYTCTASTLNSPPRGNESVPARCHLNTSLIQRRFPLCCSLSSRSFGISTCSLGREVQHCLREAVWRLFQGISPRLWTRREMFATALLFLDGEEGLVKHIQTMGLPMPQKPRNDLNELPENGETVIAPREKDIIPHVRGHYHFSSPS